MLPENSSIWNDIVDVTDKEKFYRGESAICFFMSLAEISDGSVQVVDSDMKEKITGTEIALHDGEMLSLKAGDHNIQVKCERVIDHLNTINVDTNITPGTIFVSEKLYCQLFDMDSLKYNEVIAYGNHHASYDVTDKLMSMINRNQSITFNNHRIEVEQMKKQIYMKIFYIGIVTVMFCLIFLVQMYQNQLYFLRSEMDRIHLLHELGMNQTTVAIDCIAIEDEYGNTPAQRAELDWLLYNKPLEYAQLVLGGRMERYLSLGCDHGRLED